LFYVGAEPMSTVRGLMRMKKFSATRAVRKVCPQRDKSCRCETALTTHRTEDRISVRMRVVHILSAIVLAIAILMLAIILRPSAGSDRTRTREAPHHGPALSEHGEPRGLDLRLV